MSITHTGNTPRTGQSLTEGFPVSAAITSVSNAVSGLVARLISAFAHRPGREHFTRFSNYRLQDIGYERDWDGSIIPVTPDARLPWSTGK